MVVARVDVTRTVRAEIIAVGSEMLTPERIDTNSLFITGCLNELGVDVIAKTVAADDRGVLAGLFGRIRKGTEVLSISDVPSLQTAVAKGIAHLDRLQRVRQAETQATDASSYHDATRRGNGQRLQNSRCCHQHPFSRGACPSRCQPCHAYRSHQWPLISATATMHNRHNPTPNALSF